MTIIWMKPENCRAYTDRFEVFSQEKADRYITLLFHESEWPEMSPFPGWTDDQLDALVVYTEPELIWAAGQCDLRIPVLYSPKKLTVFEAFTLLTTAKPINQYNQIWPQ